MKVNLLSLVNLNCDVVFMSVKNMHSFGYLSAWHLLLSLLVEVRRLPINDQHRPLPIIVLGGEVLQNLDDDNTRRLPLPCVFNSHKTMGISFFGNLRFETGCRCALLPALELKSKLFAGESVAASSVSELVAELGTVSWEIDTQRFEVWSS